MSIGTRLQELRKIEGLTLQAFGNKIGKISPSAISRMEKGDRAITERTIEIVCERFRVDDHWLRTGEGEMYKANPISINEEYSDFLIDIMRNQNVQVKNLTMRLQNLDDRQLKALDSFLDILEDLEH